MRIVRMYSGTVAGSQDWKKVEVEVDENDLESILHEMGISRTYERYEIKTKYAYQLLTYEAEIFIKTAMVQNFGVSLDSVKKELEDLKVRKNNVLEQLLKDLSA